QCHRRAPILPYTTLFRSRRAARDFIQQAFKLDPNDAFTLNNMGYLAEMDGDRETADFYYARALDAQNNNHVVALATRKDAEGKKDRKSTRLNSSHQISSY